MIQQKKSQALILYYSCSKNTQLLAYEAEKVLEQNNWLVQILPLREFIHLQSFDNPDFLILGVPVQYWTVPESAMKLIKRLPRFNNTPAFVFSTFGGCVTSNVPFILGRELSSKGAIIVGGAQMFTPHSCHVNNGNRLGNLEDIFGKGHPTKTELENFQSAIKNISLDIEKNSINPIRLNSLKIKTMKKQTSLLNRLVTIKMRKQFMPDIEYNSSRCKGCHLCISVCDSGCLTNQPGKSISLNQKKCYKCYACIEKCPTHSINTDWKKVEKLTRSAKKLSTNVTSIIVY